MTGQEHASKRDLIRRRTLLGAAAAGALAACGPLARRSKDADVIIAGAGLSGLFAAMWLADEGYKVIVLEAADRIGGRLWTLDDVPGRPEAGGSQVGQTYARIRYVAERLGVAIRDDAPPARSDRLLAIGGGQVLQSQWPASPLNPFPDPFRAVAPDAALFAATARQNPFDWAGAWRDADASADMSADAWLETAGFDSEARRLINVALNANDLSSYSMVNVWRTLQLYAQDAALGPSGGIAGGSQRLPEAMAASLGDAVRSGFAVRSVSDSGNGVAVSDGRETLYADYCVLALPFPALRKIDLSPAPPSLQRAAIDALPYTQIAHLHLAPETPFWDADGLPVDMWTDGPLERVFATRDDDGAIVGLLAWINGDPARVAAAQDDAALEALAQAELRRLRPDSNGAVRLVRAVRWTEGQSYAGGAYMHWAPGQARDWAGAMGAPLGRVFFAGEHLSHLHTGMEGAMESGEAAAKAVIDASGAAKR